QVGPVTTYDVAHTGVTGPLVLGAVADDRAAHGRPGVEAVVLGEHAHAGAAAPGDPAAVGLEPPGQQVEQARLAVAVAADDPDPVTLLDADGDGVEDDRGRVLQVQGLGPQKMRHVRSRLRARGPDRRLRRSRTVPAGPTPAARRRSEA